MFTRLGHLATRYPFAVIVGWALAALAAGLLTLTPVFGPTLFERLETGEPRVPGSDSTVVADLLADAAGGESITALVTDVDLGDPDQVAVLGDAVTATRTELTEIDGVAAVIDPFLTPLGPSDPMVAATVAASGDSFVVSATLEEDLTDDAADAAADAVVVALQDLGAQIASEGTTIVSSNGLILEAINHQIETDLIRGEAIALPIALLVMVVVFGGALAAGMPIVGALASIAGGMAAVLGLSFLLELDAVVVNVVSVLGLGLSIDYGLLMVSRFREEIFSSVAAEQAAITAGIPVGRRRRRRDRLVTSAVEHTVATAGRTVVFSGLTIAICVLGLALMRADILRGIGLASAFVVFFALVSAVTLVPALLTLSGRRFLRPSVLSRVPGLRSIVGRLGDSSPEDGVFSRLAGWVQARAWWVLVATASVLLALAWPVGSMHLINTTTELLPEGTEHRTFLETLTADYPLLATAPMTVVLPGGAAEPEASELASDIAGIEGVLDVAEPVVIDGTDRLMLGVWLGADDAGSREAVEVVHAIRALDGDHLVGGQAAGQVDFMASLAEGLPLAGGLIVLATFVLLFLMTGSVLIPVKALLTNALSISASLGITVLVFQEGYGSDLLGFTSLGGIESYIVAIVMAFGFGLAMDYEVFLISRIKEFYDAGASNDEAVRRGLQRSGRIITSAALVIIVVFAGFAAGELLPIKQAGFALAVAVALDATLVRMLLVPATMTVLGDLNWWAPAWLRPVARRFAITH